MIELKEVLSKLRNEKMHIERMICEVNGFGFANENKELPKEFSNLRIKQLELDSEIKKTISKIAKNI